MARANLLVESNVAAEIKRLHEEILEAYHTTLAKAVRIGELLVARKKNLRHGAFGQWVKDALPFSVRTATNYMRLYRERETLQAAKVEGMADAYRLIAGPSKAPAQEGAAGGDRPRRVKSETVSDLTPAERLLIELVNARWEVMRRLGNEAQGRGDVATADAWRTLGALKLWPRQYLVRVRGKGEITRVVWRWEEEREDPVQGDWEPGISDSYWPDRADIDYPSLEEALLDLVRHLASGSVEEATDAEE